MLAFHSQALEAYRGLQSALREVSEKLAMAEGRLEKYWGIPPRATLGSPSPGERRAVGGNALPVRGGGGHRGGKGEVQNWKCQNPHLVSLSLQISLVSTPGSTT